MDGKASILIVDDDVAMGETLSDILEEKGYDVAVAANGLEAIDEVKKQHFDLALVDIVMPDVSGVETLRRIKELDPDVTTMIMTGHSAMEKSISEALDTGVDRVLFKPFNVEAIVELISRETGATTEDAVSPALGPQAPGLRVGPNYRVGMPAVDLRKYQIQPEVLRLIPEKMAKKHNVMPLHIEGDSLLVAMSDPYDLYTLDSLQFRTGGMDIKPLRATLTDIQEAIKLHYGAMAEIEKEVERMPPALVASEESNEKAGILIVDDDVSMCETLSDILEAKGYRVVVAQDGPTAIEEVKSQHFDLALIDIVMPGMNGVETLREIKAVDSQITTMMITGYTALGESVSKALKAGVDGVLYKPLDIDVIVEMITGRTEAPGLPRVDLKRYEVQPDALRLIPEAVARKWDLIPLRIERGSLVVAMADPDNLYAIEDVRALSRMEVKVLRAALMDIRGAINLHYRAMGEIEKEIRHIIPTAPEWMEAEDRISPDLIAQAPVVRAVNLLVAQAVKDRASDIHIEPQQDRLRVRYRIDGILHDTLSLPLSVHGPLISRVKVLAAMNIAERRRPQDGHFTISADGTEVDIRVATADTSWGEMAVLRVLDKSMSVMDLPELGFLPDSLEIYQRLIQSPFGMILAAGPTGSGKTTTLYASINQLDAKGRNIITIEDPIEYRFADINQMQVNLQADITFARGLRATMRLDPDIILVGEIRDPETASIAIQAALTGHLVLSSVHANDAVGALFRLMDLGIEPFLITSAIVGIIAQRLVRRVCPHCRVLREAPEEEQVIYEKEMGEKRTRFYQGTGCNFCALTGYHGRMGVYEVLMISEEIRRLVLKGASTDAIKAQAIEEGMVTMWCDGMLKVQAGLTTPREVLRNVFVIG